MSAQSQVLGRWRWLAKWSSDPSNSRQAAPILLVADALLTLLTVQTVPHFNIDFQSYMQQADSLNLGERNYSRLVGPNGPLVYPAGHAWLHLGLHHLTEGGLNTQLAQQLSILTYLVNLALVFRLLLRTELVPPYLLAILSIGATRVRTITVLHLFNDPIAVLFLHAAVNMFLDNRWALGSFFFSLGVSVKMNILLFAPALLCLYLNQLGVSGTILQLTICALVQLILAAPFLVVDPVAYLTSAFNLTRSFLHRDSVNFAFLSRELFLSRGLHCSLLAAHISLLVYLALTFWPNLLSDILTTKSSPNQQPDQLADNRNNNNNNNENKDPKENKVKRHLPSPRWMIRWRTHLTLAGIATMVPALISLPPFHPILVHGLFWPSLAIILTYPAITIANLFESKVFVQMEGREKMSAVGRGTNNFLLPFFAANFFGVVCAKSIHVQFYSWYFYSLHYLLCHTNFTTKFKLLLLSNIEASYFSLEINTIISYLLKFGCDQWEFFERWANSACVEHISLERDHRGFEIESAAEAPNHCRRGTAASSVALQVAHWTIVVNLLWQFWRRSQPSVAQTGEKLKSKSGEEGNEQMKSKKGEIKTILGDKQSLSTLQRILINLNQLKKVLINQNQL